MTKADIARQIAKRLPGCSEKLERSLTRLSPEMLIELRGRIDAAVDGVHNEYQKAGVYL